MAQVEVPAFPCIVHLNAEGGVYRGRVANLAGLEAEASSERELLGKIVPLFKTRRRRNSSAWRFHPMDQSRARAEAESDQAIHPCASVMSGLGAKRGFGSLAQQV